MSHQMSRMVLRNQLRNQIITDKEHPKYGKKMGNKLMGQIWRYYTKETVKIEEKYRAEVLEAKEIKNIDKSLRAVVAAKNARDLQFKRLNQMVFKKQF